VTREELQEKYPKIFGNTAICVGDGWLPLIESLAHFLQWHHDKNGYPQTVALQIKEKFGQLCFYFSTEENTTGNPFKRDTSFVEGAVWFAEHFSTKICEECGKPGKQREGGWVKCLCNECAKEHGYYAESSV